MQSFKNPLFIHPNHEHYYCVNIWKKFFGILDAPLFIIPSSEIDLLHKQSLALIKKFNEHSYDLNQISSLNKIKFIKLYECFYRLN